MFRPRFEQSSSITRVEARYVYSQLTPYRCPVTDMLKEITEQKQLRIMKSEDTKVRSLATNCSHVISALALCLPAVQIIR
jgi:hypothetical protein